MKDELKKMNDSIDEASIYFSKIITVDDMTSYKVSYPNEFLLSGTIASMALGDINARLKHLIQFLPISYTFTKEEKVDIVNVSKKISEDFDASVKALEYAATNTIGTDMSGGIFNVRKIILEIVNDVTANAFKIVRIFEK